MENQFGKYTLLKKLGDGGMAEVFLAEMKGPEGFSKRVAIKRILPHLSHDSVFTESFINEARLGGYLNHHNIVQTLDFGQIDGFYYLAMEYVQGMDLRQILQQVQKDNQPLPLTLAIDVAFQICEGLVYAHQATDAARRPLRMIHRDLKPSNILINEHGVVKIADFGVARAESNIAHTQRASGNPKGTVAYMSPEQAMGSLDLDQRADVFSLGSIFFELVANERLYTAPTYLGALRQAQDGEVTERLAMVAAMPGRDVVGPLLERALAPDRNDRYPNSRAFAKDLRRALMQVESEENLADYLERMRRGETAPPPSARPRAGDATAEMRAAAAPVPSAPVPASPGAFSQAAAAGGFELGNAAPDDEVFTVQRPAFVPEPTPAPPTSSDARRAPTASRSSSGAGPVDTSGRKPLDSQTLRPRGGEARPRRRLGGTLMAGAAAVVLVIIGAVVTLALIGRPSKVRIETDPASATIELPDGTSLSAPQEVRVPPEGLALKITAPGHEAKDLPIPGGAPDGQLWRVKLQALAANLVVEVTPPEAMLKVNGLFVPGRSPFSLPDVASNEPLDLAVSAEGFLPQTRQVTVAPGESQTATFTLEREPTPVPRADPPAPVQPNPRAPDPPHGSHTVKANDNGFLRCNAVPKGGGSMWARVFVDGKYVGNTPMMKQAIPVGAHKILLVTEDGRQEQRSVTIEKGRTATLLVEFN